MCCTQAIAGGLTARILAPDPCHRSRAGEGWWSDLGLGPGSSPAEISTARRLTRAFQYPLLRRPHWKPRIFGALLISDGRPCVLSCFSYFCRRIDYGRYPATWRSDAGPLTALEISDARRVLERTRFAVVLRLDNRKASFGRGLSIRPSLATGLSCSPASLSPSNLSRVSAVSARSRDRWACLALSRTSSWLLDDRSNTDARHENQPRT